MANAYLRDGKWYVSFNDANGKRVQKSSGARTKDAAERY